MPDEEATISAGVQRQIALAATDEQPIERKVAISENTGAPVRRITSQDFLNYFA